MNRKMLVRLTVFAALVAMIAIAALQRNQINSAALETWVKGAGPAGPLLYMVLYAVATVLFLPAQSLRWRGAAGTHPRAGRLPQERQRLPGDRRCRCVASGRRQIEPGHHPQTR